MFGKIFDSIYNGTLGDDWRALITFQQMIVLCDADGTVDMTPAAIARRTGIPIEHITEGIRILEAVDPNSRTADDDGRRIMRLDDHRDWGWSIINHEKYKRLHDAASVRAGNRERKRRQRKRNAGLPEHDLQCAYCGGVAVGPDHVIATSNGGDNSESNVVPCCSKCNNHKASQNLVDFLNDPHVDWIQKDLILSNPVLMSHVSHNGHAYVTQVHASSHHTDTDIDIDTDTTKKNARAVQKRGKEWLEELQQLHQSLMSSADKSIHADRIDKMSRDDAFDLFWMICPAGKKRGKRTASTAFKNACARAQKSTIIIAFAEYSVSALGRSKFVCLPATFLNQDRWEDDRAAWSRDEDDNDVDVMQKIKDQLKGKS